MWGNRLWFFVGVSLLLIASPALRGWANEVVEVEFSQQINAHSVLNELAALQLKGMFYDGAVGEPALPWKAAFMHGQPVAEGFIEFRILNADTLELNHFLPPKQPDIITSDTATVPQVVGFDTDVYGRDLWYPCEPVSRWRSGSVHGHPVSSFIWCPFQYNPLRRQLIVIRRAIIGKIGAGQGSPGSDPPDTIAASDDMTDLLLARLRSSELEEPDLTPGLGGTPAWSWPEDPPAGVSYVAITGGKFVSIMRRLIQWKARRGVNAGLATVDAIQSTYPGVDEAESIREYLQDAYTSGLQWVLLGGDETVVPMRLAYAGYEESPSDPYELQICDLYFAELDGDWDADGDGLYGEYFGDEAELTAELFVGRLPFSDSIEAEAIVDKIISYERGPADADYLTQALSVSADQMRDWSGGIGQHREIADRMPAHWTVNQSSMIEAPSGDSPLPTAPDGPSLLSLLADGYGWVNYFVHGRADGMVVRASGYSEWPKSYVWTFGSSGDGHGHLNELPTSPYPGIHLSIGCNHGGFDMDTPPFAPGTGESVVERLIFTAQGGAVAFVAQSRWGWVSTSYRILDAFYGHVADESTPNHMGVYQTLARSALPHYRDLNFGNNLYGDPEMPVWKGAPQEWSVQGPTTYDGSSAPWMVEVHDAGGPVAGALATVAVGDTIWSLGLTDETGSASGVLTLPSEAEAVLTVSKPGYRVFIDTVPHAIISDVDDEEESQSEVQSVFVCSPNPFNPSATLRFSIDEPRNTELVVYDILGRTIRILLHDELEAGTHQLNFDGRDDGGRPLASGVYIARLSQAGMSKAIKMVVLR